MRLSLSRGLHICTEQSWRNQGVNKFENSWISISKIKFISNFQFIKACDYRHHIDQIKCWLQMASKLCDTHKQTDTIMRHDFFFLSFFHYFKVRILQKKATFLASITVGSQILKQSMFLGVALPYKPLFDIAEKFRNEISQELKSLQCCNDFGCRVRVCPLQWQSHIIFVLSKMSLINGSKKINWVR